MTDSLRRGLTEFKSNLDLLPEADEPPSTTLQIIRNNQQEQDWQRLLFHYLSPDESHGLDYALLEHLLTALSERSRLDVTFSRFDLADIQIEQEVTLSDGRRPDAVIWASEEWFICFELKVGASEDEDQTRDYVQADGFQSINLKKENVDSPYYIYVAPDGSSPEADDFVPVSWEWIGEEIQTFLTESQGKYPARTIAQLETFAATIQSELQMTDYQENKQEKVELYVEHYNQISEVQQVFDEQWEQFRKTWGTRLIEVLDTAVMIDNPDVQDGNLIAEIANQDIFERSWTLFQDTDFAAIRATEGWRTELDGAEEKAAKVYFHHRLGDRYKPVAVGEKKLKFWLRNETYKAPDGFNKNFARKFKSDEDIPNLLPARTSRTGNKVNTTEATYDINVDSHSNFFEAYIAALSLAIDEHIISNPELVNRINKIYQQTIEENTAF